MIASVFLPQMSLDLLCILICCVNGHRCYIHETKCTGIDDEENQIRLNLTIG